MTKPVTLNYEQEAAIASAAQALRQLEACQHILSPSTYRAAQRDVLRNLVRRTFATHITTGERIP